MEVDHKYAAVCIIENNLGHILLLQRRQEPYGFCLPGGKVEDGETIIDGAMREVLEETGIRIELTIDDLLGEVMSGWGIYMVKVFYKKIEHEEVAISLEHIGYAWTIHPANALLLAGNTDEMIKLWEAHNEHI